MANPSPSLNKYTVAATAINQLSANQMAMWLHMQNMSLHNSAPPTHVANLMVVYNQPCTAAAYQQHQLPAPVYAPSIQALNIPAPFQGGDFSQGRGGRGNGGRTWHCNGRGGRGSSLFGNAGQSAGTVFCPRWSSLTSVWSIPTGSGPCSSPTQLYSPPHQKI